MNTGRQYRVIPDTSMVNCEKTRGAPLSEVAKVHANDRMPISNTVLGLPGAESI